MCSDISGIKFRIKSTVISSLMKCLKRLHRERYSQWFKEFLIALNSIALQLLYRRFYCKIYGNLRSNGIKNYLKSKVNISNYFLSNYNSSQRFQFQGNLQREMVIGRICNYTVFVMLAAKPMLLLYSWDLKVNQEWIYSCKELRPELLQLKGQLFQGWN